MIFFSDDLKARGMLPDGLLTTSDKDRVLGTKNGSGDGGFSSLKRGVEELMGSTGTSGYSSLEDFVGSRCRSGKVVVDKGVHRGNRIGSGTWEQFKLLSRLDKAEDAVFALCKTVNEISVEVADGGYYLMSGTEKLFVFSRRCKTCMMYRDIRTPIGNLTIGLDDNGIDVYYFMEVLK